ncbi:MAG: 3-oxoacyl-ACP reductase FabG [Deltaproteobacteria bacterium]|nr:3-oxoacyl-ACP reductase FabG [Deltaproteobacteria bacterium]MBI4223344.1 3-oxoacyl-ACP reductase FabG [Deltaproteobacteria bacterium]
MKRLKGKSALITGSSRGIGRAIALAFAREGAKIAVTYRRQKEAAEKVVRQICDQGGEAALLPLDVSEPDQIKQAIAETARHFGSIDILVNNAGMNRVNDFDKQTLEEWNEVLAVNLTGVFLCCQAALPHIPEGGRIINIGSVSGQLGGPRSPAYAAAKAGVMALTHCLARFTAPRKITVNCLSPGIVASAMTDQTMPASLRETRLRNILLGRLGTYEEIAEAALFLASPEAGFITAETLNVNGGEWW